ncbi:MAG: sulfite exporter TauE/SafE family protein [Spirochaetaceae bacterium]|nr:MAG: sulfite exporter TauE/SafE family protein [Spirochaetaceae bacterium]
MITEVFGFASGLYAYARKRLIDYKMGLILILATVPLALLGAWAAGWIPSTILKVILGVGLFTVAVSFLRSSNAAGYPASYPSLPACSWLPSRPFPLRAATLCALHRAAGRC